MDRRLGEPQSRSGRGGKTKFLTLLGLELRRTESFLLFRDSKTDHSDVQLVASRYTDYVDTLVRGSGKNLSPAVLSVQIISYDNLRGRNVGIIDERVLLGMPLSWPQVAWHTYQI
jgi:hypothetical protein